MSLFNSIIGNDFIKDFLTRKANSPDLPNSWLFSGPEGIGKSLCAKAFAEHILGHEQHPDLHQYYPEGKLGLHSINSMRKFTEEVYIAPFSANRKVFIIYDAERMWPYGANALLKTFEEPAEDAIIILVSSAPELLLPTILSRCFTLRFQSLTNPQITFILKDKYAQSNEEAEKLAYRSQGSLGKAVMLLEGGGNEIRAMILQLLSKKETLDYCLLRQELEAITHKLEEMKKKVEESCRQDLLLTPPENLSAIQLDSIEKEIDGVAAMKIKQDIRSLFEVIMGWFRDMELIRVGGNRHYLIHSDYEKEIEQAFQRGELQPLERIQEIIAKALLSLERSISLNLCLENIFLQI